MLALTFFTKALFTVGLNTISVLLFIEALLFIFDKNPSDVFATDLIVGNPRTISIVKIARALVV
jgi:hypothetical protein